MRGVVPAVLLILLAGCTGPICYRPVLSAWGVAADAPHEAGVGQHNVTITVTDADGAPLPGAAVRAYWASPDAEESLAYAMGVAMSFGLLIIADPDGPPVEVVYMDARTDARGQVVIHVPQGHPLTVVAATTGFTEEWLVLGAVNATIPAAGTVALYPRFVEAGHAGTLTGADLRWRYIDGSTPDQAWLPKDLYWHEDPQVAREMTRRLVDLEVVMEWETAPGSQGDLGLGLGETVLLVDQNSGDELLELGPHEERIALTLDDLVDLQVAGEGRIRAGPTYEAKAAPLGLTYTITMRGTLGPETIRERYCVPHLDVESARPVAQVRQAVEATSATPTAPPNAPPEAAPGAPPTPQEGSGTPASPGPSTDAPAQQSPLGLPSLALLAAALARRAKPSCSAAD